MKKRLLFRIISNLLIMIFVINLCENFKWMKGNVATNVDVNAAGANVDVDSIQSSAKAAAVSEIEDQLDAEGITLLPALEEYYAEHGGAPKVISYAEFQENVGIQETFNLSEANRYSDYKIRIDHKEDLFSLSELCDSSVNPSERDFYLSASYILGNNIEYNQGDFDGDGDVDSKFIPIGTDEHPFVGTFDGQGFEVRQLFVEIDNPDHRTISMFDVIGSAGIVRNFGMFSVAPFTELSGTAVANPVAFIATKNNGTIEKVYCDLSTMNPTNRAANITLAGLVMENNGTLQDCYFAGKMNMEGDNSVDPICYTNNGTIAHAYYDSQILGHAVSGYSSETGTTVIGASTFPLKTLGLDNTTDSFEFENDTDDTYHWHVDDLDGQNASRGGLNWRKNNPSATGYPKLYGFTSEFVDYYRLGNVLDLEISTPADMVYFPQSSDYRINDSVCLFHITNDIDMSYVADDAYVPTNNMFRGAIDGAVPASGNALYNNSYSLINFRITQANKDGTTYRCAMIGYSFASYKGLDQVSNLNLIGGGIKLGQIEHDQTTGGTIYAGMLVATHYSNATQNSFENIHSSADVILENDTYVPNVIMGSLFGDIYRTKKLKNVTNVGTVNAGYHPNYSACDFSGSRIGGIGGIILITDTGLMQTVVNYGEVIGLGIYDTMSTNAERSTSTILNESVNYASRASGVRIGGIMGWGDGWQRSFQFGCYDYVANFGDIYDVPYTMETVDFYEEDGTRTTKERPIGIVPNENLYIINMATTMAGICTRFFETNATSVRNFYGYDATQEKFVEDTGYKARLYNFGNMTAVESRSCSMIGLTNGSGEIVFNQKNFGDFISYTYYADIHGITARHNWANTVGVFCSDNYGNVYVDHSSRSARRTIYSGSFSLNIYGITCGYINCVDCNNYGNINVSYNGVNRGITAVSTDNNVLKAYISGINRYSWAKRCDNYGDISVNVFDHWTGRYNYNELSEEKWYNINGGKVNNNYCTSLSRFRGDVTVWGISCNTSGNVTECVNYGDISIKGTPYELLNDDSYNMVSSFEELCEEWGISYPGGYNSTFGYNGDAEVIRSQNALGDAWIEGIGEGHSTAVFRDCINKGDLSFENLGQSANNIGIYGIAYMGDFTDCANLGDITVHTQYSSGEIFLFGISRYFRITMENCINTGNIYADVCNSSVDIAGIVRTITAYCDGIMSNCINMGNLTHVKTGIKKSLADIRTRIGGIITTYGDGLSACYNSKYKIYGCANYGDITYDADYEPNVKHVPAGIQNANNQYTPYSADTIASISNKAYTAKDQCYVGGIIAYTSYSYNEQGTDSNVRAVNSCLNHGDINVSRQHLYTQDIIYAGGIMGIQEAAAASVSAKGNIYTNLINHGTINVDLLRDSFYYQGANYTNAWIAGIIGRFTENNSGAQEPFKSIFENIVNTGSLNINLHGNSSNKPNVGGFMAQFTGSTRFTNSDDRAETQHTYTYFDGIIDYQSDYRLIGNDFGASYYFLNNDVQYGEPIDIYYGNNAEPTIIYNKHRIIMGDRIYSAYPENETYTFGQGNHYIMLNGVRTQIQPTTYTVKKLTLDDIYPTETTPELLQYGYINPITDVVCSFEYLNLGGLSEKYRDVYRSVNGITYDAKPQGDESDEAFTSSAEYQAWAEQKGGYVLRGASFEVAGEDYIPDNMMLSDIQPTSCQEWYREIYKNNRTYNEALYVDWSQVNLLDLKEILSIIVTDGDEKTISFRRQTTENENIFYVFVPVGMTGTLSVDSFRISSKAEAEFFDENHNRINNFRGYSFDFDGENEVTMYATVTAQNQSQKDWTIIVKTYDNRKRFVATSGFITKSKKIFNNATTDELLYTQTELEDGLESLNFWDTPMYHRGNTFRIYLETINIEGGYVLTDHMTHYYYPQNGYGVTAAGLALGIDKNTDLAELIESSNDYHFDENGDLYKNGTMILELLQEVNLAKDENDEELYLTDGDIIKTESDGVTLKAEKYSCYKGENTGDYYLENEGKNILWSFVTEAGEPISRNDEDFYTEDGAYKRIYSNNNYLDFNRGNRVILNTGEGEEDGLLKGTFLLQNSFSTYMQGGYYETEFTLPDGTTQSIYYAKARDDEARPWVDDNYDTLGYADGQWISSESARARSYDAHGAYHTWQDAHDALQASYDAGETFPYIYTLQDDHRNISHYGFDYFQDFEEKFIRQFPGFGGRQFYQDYYSNVNYTKPYYYNFTYYNNGAINRFSLDRIVRNDDGSINYLDLIIQDTSENLGVTRYHVMKFIYSDIPKYSNSRYSQGNDTFATMSENVVIDNTAMVAQTIPKTIESTNITSTYTKMAKFDDERSFYAVRYCEEGGTTFGDYFKAEESEGSYTAELTSNGESFSLTMTPILNVERNTFQTAINANTRPGYYEIVPVCAKTKYVYVYDYDDFIDMLDAQDISTPAVDKGYTVERMQSVSGYDIYAVTIYEQLESIVIHKRANDDSYLKHIFMVDENGKNLSSVESDIMWDNSNTSATSETNWNNNHTSVANQSNSVRYRDGYVRYNADPEYSDNENEVFIGEKVNAFVSYAYIRPYLMVNGVRTLIEDTYMSMNKSFIPVNASLYYRNNGNWIKILFDDNGEVISSQKEYFHYTDFWSQKEEKQFKIVAENGNVSYYKIYATINKRDKPVNVVLSDDAQTRELLEEIKDKYGTFVSDMHLVIEGEANTAQAGIYEEVGASGNNYCLLKYGYYDFTFNVPESDGYAYQLYYTIDGRDVPMERSKEDPKAFRLPLRIGSGFIEGQDLTVTIRIRKNSNIIWGRQINNIMH